MKNIKKSITATAYLLLVILAISCSKSDITHNDSSKNGKSGSITKFAIVDKYLYALNNNLLDVYDISDKYEPVKINSIAIDFTIETIFSYNGKLYIGASDGIFIVDISIPEVPELKGTARHQYGCDPIVVKGYVGYSTISISRQCGSITSNSALNILDVTNDYYPVIVKSIPLAEAKGLGYDGNTLLVCKGEYGLDVYDIAAPHEFNPVKISSYRDVNALDVIADNGILIVSSPDKYSFFDYSNLPRLVLLNSILKN